MSEKIPAPAAAPDSDIEARIDAIEQRIDARGLTEENKYRDLLIDEVRQRMTMRRWLSWLAFAVILAMMALVYHAGHETIPLWQMGTHPAYGVALIVTPIISISAITIVLLIGAFRRFQDQDIDRVDVPSLMAEAAKAAALQS